MKVLLIARGAGPFGGSGRNMGNMRKALSSLGYEVFHCGVDGSFISTVLSIRRAARSADIVQAVDINPVGYAAYLATRFLDTKLVIICQAAYAIAPLHSRAAPLARFVYRHADGIVAGSVFVADEIRKEVPNIKIETIDPGIDINEFAESRAKQFRTKEPLVLSVGAVKERKGYKIAVQAIALLRQKIPDVRYVIVGSLADSPGFVEELKILIRKLELQDQIEFRPNASDEELKSLYQEANLFLLPSVNRGFHFEGFGMVFLEAASYGVPTVGTKGNGIADAVEDGGSGFLVPQDDPAATAAAALRILTDKELAEKMSVRARSFAKEHDLSHIAKRYERLYVNLMGQIK